MTDDGFESLPTKKKRSQRKDTASATKTSYKKNSNKKNAFGNSSWSKPTKPYPLPLEPSSSETPQSTPPRQQEAAVESMGTATSANYNKVHQDPPDDRIATSTAPRIQDTHVNEQEETGDFLGRCQAQPLSALLESYGAYDPNWQNVQPTSTTDPEPAATTTHSETTATPRFPNRLVLQGKAPIHVEFESFSYHHGAPSRQGWSHAQPLAAFDVRDLPMVPAYLAWQHGLSGAVKRALLYNNHNKNNDDDNDNEAKDVPSIKELAQDIANQVATALRDAIRDGHGYALPLNMTIYVGSDLGRHRSVVVCEQAATVLRKHLRANLDNQFGQPCSVGTRHPYVEQRSKQQPIRSKPSKQNALEAGW